MAMPRASSKTVLTVTVSQRARLSYLALFAVYRSFHSSGTSSSSSSSSTSNFHRSDFTSQPYTGTYEPGLPTSGPLGDASIFGTPRLTPKALKQHLDLFVVGQERAKRVLSVAVYNHYQRIHELQRRDDEEEQLLQQQARRDHGQRHPVEDEFPGQTRTIRGNGRRASRPIEDVTAPPLLDFTPLTIEKSNILMLGPSGVGKTLMAKTLARVLEVPFSMSDCTPFTQAGYIGEDADVCVQRLLAAANYDVARAERGIICLDEVDKIATAKVNHGKDVSGEGVQQALLKIIEGTTLQISAKNERAAARPTGQGAPGSGSGGLGGGGGGGGSGGGLGSSPTGANHGKNEVYNVRTDNILFICTGAFVGLHKIVMDRVSRGSIGFAQPVRASGADNNNAALVGDDDLFKKHLPFFTDNAEAASASQRNALDLVEPDDLRRYGMIPELVGRLPVTTALTSLDEESLVRVLTEPRNSLTRQYSQLFQLSNVELRCTSAALRQIARTALDMGTGARGLRTVLERLLGDAMFEAPGSSIRYILITEAVAERKQAPLYFARGQQSSFHAMIAAEEEEWEARRKSSDRGDDGPDGQAPATDRPASASVRSFEQYRSRATASGGS